MSSTPRRTRTARPTRSWCRHLLRALGEETNALSRPLDRARSRALLLAALGIALAALLGTGTALADLSSVHHRAAVTAAHLHRLQAVVLTPARQTAPAIGGGMPDYQAEAAWTYPPGQRRTGTVDLSWKAAPGSTTGIWVSDTGHLTDPPPSPTDVLADAIFLGLFTLGGLSVLIAAGLGARLRSLDRRAERAWQHSWAQLEPVWTGRAPRRPGSNDTQRS